MSKEDDLAAIGALLRRTQTSYAVIGGVAAQVHLREPRTTIDIDIAVLDRAAIPAEELERAGFQRKGEHHHSSNWLAPGGTPLQFTDDPHLRDAIAAAIEVGGPELCLRVVAREDFLRAKLRAATDVSRRRSKQLMDLADIQSLLESDASLAEALTPPERTLLAKLLQ